jgi:nicotinamide riboside kinase
MEENLKQSQSAIIKIALFGPESTGKTTLAIQLAAHYNTVWAPEFARNYLQEKWDKSQLICDSNDMLPIAYGQVQLENEKVAAANKYLFCDTNLMVTKVFSEVYYNYCDPLLDKAAKEHEYDLFFLTDIDVPWKKDDLRDRPEGRETVFEVFKQALIDAKKPFITLSGDKDLRLEKAVSIVDDLAKAKEMGLSPLDFVRIYEYGLSIDTIGKQLQLIINGVPKATLVKPATLNNGILKLSEAELLEKAAFFDRKKESLSLLKFVPASGAATRMFKFLITFLNEFNIKNETINAYVNRKKDNELSLFIIAMEKFPFFKAIDETLREEFPEFDTLDSNYKNYYFIKFLLSSDYFDFANKPKGVLPFHKYHTNIATPIEKHLYECGSYSCSNGGSHLHFTVSEGHQSQFEDIVSSVKTKVEKESNTKITVSYSHQSKSSDTLAVGMDNKLFKDEAGQLVFRPGGHGALIENLNNLDADVIFIKNIDNVLHDNNEQIALYKKALAGILVELQTQVFSYLRLLKTNSITEEQIAEILVFLEAKLNVEMDTDFGTLAADIKIEFAKNALNRPIRVCGMVKNEGEPGGGPFWVRNENDRISLQIVESSQVDLESEDQAKILASSTHFNPVDLVCGINNYKNEKFDLKEFVNYNSGFIVEKNIAGKSIKAYELPGLWNGAMANWLTVFVEVPLITFNPVKMVNDLLKQAHQSK